MKVLLTGSRGAIGSMVGLAIERAGHEVVPVDLPDHDLAEPGVASEAARGCDTILHLAGHAHPGGDGRLSGQLDKLLRPNVVALLRV